jgi:POT family proton-dependent oligopeptide transporter
MRALLIFYLTKHWLFSDSEAGIVYGAYTALVYITPVLGGYLADRYLGQRKAVQFGAVLLTLGHFFMAFEGAPAAGHQDNPVIYVFWLALALIIVGSGFLKANISVIVGQLYPRTDVRRDAAYTIFYMGINLGAAIGSLLCGYIGETYGWSYGFGLAGIGMLAGLAVFVWGRPMLLGRGEPPRTLARSTEWKMYGAGIAMVGLCWAAVQFQALVGYVLGGFGGALVLYVLFTAVTKLAAEERDRIFAAMFLILTSIIFWALFEQAGSSLNLFTDRHVDRGGVPASVFQSINAIYIILLAPIFAAGWQLLGRRGMEPSAPFKFGLGVVQVGLGFLVLVWGARSVGLDVPTPVILIFLIYLLHTTGELCLSPVGLSAMNRLAPAHMASLIMGTWFFASATGNFAAGLIAAATGGEGVGEAAGKSVVLDVYSTVGWVAVGVGIAVLVISPLIKRLMHLESLRDDDVSDDLLGQKEGPGEPQAAGMHPETRSS